MVGAHMYGRCSHVWQVLTAFVYMYFILKYFFMEVLNGRLLRASLTLRSDHASMPSYMSEWKFVIPPPPPEGDDLHTLMCIYCDILLGTLF